MEIEAPIIEVGKMKDCSTTKGTGRARKTK